MTGWLEQITVTAAADPVGVTEIAARLNVKRGTVDAWRLRPWVQFPEARWSVGGRPAWDWSDVAAWAQATGRVIP